MCRAWRKVAGHDTAYWSLAEEFKLKPDNCVLTWYHFCPGCAAIAVVCSPSLFRRQPPSSCRARRSPSRSAPASTAVPIITRSTNSLPSLSPKMARLIPNQLWTGTLTGSHSFA